MQRIKSVGVMSVAKIMGLIYGAIGLLIVPFFLVIGLASSMAMKHAQSAGGNFPAAMGPIFAVFMAIAAPIAYGLMGFVMGALSALIYNLIAGWVGGIELELEIAPVQAVFASQPPPPPLPQAPLA